jgi:hypothetical protein
VYYQTKEGRNYSGAKTNQRNNRDQAKIEKRVEIRILGPEYSHIED